MGVVWLVEDQRWRDGDASVQVALKFLAPEIRVSPEAMGLAGVGEVGGARPSTLSPRYAEADGWYFAPGSISMAGASGGFCRATFRSAGRVFPSHHPSL